MGLWSEQAVHTFTSGKRTFTHPITTLQALPPSDRAVQAAKAAGITVKHVAPPLIAGKGEVIQQCSDCSEKQIVPTAELRHAARRRCSLCGGPLNRLGQA